MVEPQLDPMVRKPKLVIVDDALQTAEPEPTNRALIEALPGPVATDVGSTL